MEKVNIKQLRTIENKMTFYDFNDLSTRKESQLLVRFKKEVNATTYSDIQFNGNEKHFYSQKQELKTFILKLFNSFTDEDCVIRKYEVDWIIDKTLSSELFECFIMLGIQNSSNEAICVKKNDEIINLLLESVFRYNSFIQFLFEKAEVVVSPSDHLDVFIASNNPARMKSKITKCLKSLDEENLEIVER